MRVGEGGQVAIPKEIRDRFGIGPESEVEFQVIESSIVLRKKPKKLNLTKCKGRGKARLARLGYKSADQFVEDLRGR